MLRQYPQLTGAHSWLPARVLGFARAGGHEQLPIAEQLSERERQVLGTAAQLLSTEEIGAELHISANTVKSHLKSIYRKLSVTRRSEAVRRARDLGVLAPDIGDRRPLGQSSESGDAEHGVDDGR
jgi:LuxR family maltose regulon positive regulatory protein